MLEIGTGESATALTTRELRVLDWIDRAHDDVLAAVTWCRLGRIHPVHERAFDEAKRLGLLAQDSTWRATAKGEGALIAAGIMAGEPAPERHVVHVLWARSSRFPRPQFVAAFNDGLVNCWPDEYERRRQDAELDWESEGFDPGGDSTRWTFSTTVEYLSPVLASALELAP